MSTQEHMLGQGFYNQHAQEQGAANRFGLDLIQQAIPQIARTHIGDVFRAADYGSAQGHNSLLPLKTALDTLQQTHGKPLPFAMTVTHTDLPTNDWTTLFETVLNDPRSYLAGTPNVFPFASGVSMYQQIFPPQQIAFGYSAIATHWLSRTPSRLTGIWSPHAQGAEHDAWAKQARADWYNFLQARNSEMVPSGQLVMVNSGADARGNSGAEPLLDLANAVLQTMVQAGELHADEYAAMAIPTYYRVEREWREPFEDVNFIGARSLHLVHYQEFALEDVNLNQYAQTHDAEAFAKNDVAFFRAAFEPALFAALDGSRTPAERAQLIAAFTQRMQTALAQNPDAYAARWVLQLMWIAKG